MKNRIQSFVVALAIILAGLLALAIYAFSAAVLPIEPIYLLVGWIPMVATWLYFVEKYAAPLIRVALRKNYPVN